MNDVHQDVFFVADPHDPLPAGRRTQRFEDSLHGGFNLVWGFIGCRLSVRLYDEPLPKPFAQQANEERQLLGRDADEVAGHMEERDVLLAFSSGRHALDPISA
jgi:hypothetical protein